MDYKQACNVVVSKKEARAEIERHGALWKEFIKDCGERESYRGRVVLNWLGY